MHFGSLHTNLCSRPLGGPGMPRLFPILRPPSSRGRRVATIRLFYGNIKGIFLFFYLFYPHFCPKFFFSCGHNFCRILAKNL